MPLIEILACMERWGVKLDTQFLGELSHSASKQIYALEKDVYKLAEMEFNLNSPKQLQEILFEKLALSAERNKKIKTGISTAAGELEKCEGLTQL